MVNYFPVAGAVAAAMSAPEGASFDATAHAYTLHGQPMVSVTQILNEEGLIDFSMVPKHRLAEAQERGTGVHQAMHYHLEGDLAPASVREDWRGYVASGVAYIEASPLRVLATAAGAPVGVEFRWWDPALWCAGTIDWIAVDLTVPHGRRRSKGAFVIVDWKTGEPDDVAAPIQTAAYAEGARRHLIARLPPEYHAWPILRRAVKLHRDGRIGTPEPYTDLRDWPLFLNALNCAHYRRNGCRHETPASRELIRAAAGFM